MYSYTHLRLTVQSSLSPLPLFNRKVIEKLFKPLSFCTSFGNADSGMHHKNVLLTLSPFIFYERSVRDVCKTEREEFSSWGWLAAGIGTL